jgi:hypothetical protein
MHEATNMRKEWMDQLEGKKGNRETCIEAIEDCEMFLAHPASTEADARLWSWQPRCFRNTLLEREREEEMDTYLGILSRPY